MANTPAQSTPQPLSLALPEGLTPDSIDTLPVLSALISRFKDRDAEGGAPPYTKKDVLPETDVLRHKLMRARAQVRMLPDVERSVGEQEEEIKELEERIGRQREALGRLRELGRELGGKRESVG